MLFVFPSKLYADFTFSVPQTAVTADEDINMDVTLSLQGQNEKVYYIEGAIKKEGSSNYFGLTWNDSSWVQYTASDFTTLKQITTDQAGKWNGSIKTKIDKNNNLFSGNGTYTLRLKRFTTGGSYYWADNFVVLTVSLISSTATQAPATPAPVAPSSTPISTISPAPQPTSLFTISNVPSQLNSDQSFSASVNLNLPNNHNSVYYLSGAFKKADSTRYFGLIKTSSNWIKYESANYLNQYKITTDESGHWTGTVEVKPDILDSSYKGPGDYIFKIGRYTASGSGPTWSNEAVLQINGTENSENDISIPQPTSTVNSSISSPSSVSISGTKSTQRPKMTYQNASVAAATISAQSTTSPSQVNIKNTVSINPLILIGSILIFAGVSSIGYIYIRKNAKVHI